MPPEREPHPTPFDLFLQPLGGINLQILTRWALALLAVALSCFVAWHSVATVTHVKKELAVPKAQIAVLTKDSQAVKLRLAAIESHVEKIDGLEDRIDRLMLLLVESATGSPQQRRRTRAIVRKWSSNPQG